SPLLLNPSLRIPKPLTILFGDISSPPHSLTFPFNRSTSPISIRAATSIDAVLLMAPLSLPFIQISIPKLHLPPPPSYRLSIVISFLICILPPSSQQFYHPDAC